MFSTSWRGGVALVCGAWLGLGLGSHVRAEEALQEVKAEKLVLNVPSKWKKQQPTSMLRLAQFEIPAAEGDTGTGELVVFPPFGGTKEQNIKRWIDQFEVKDRMVKLSQGTANGSEYLVAEISGTYRKPIGPPIAQKTEATPGSRMVAIIVSVKEAGNYFLKLTGPDKTVTAAAEGLRTSFGAKAETETEYKPAAE